mmetsp:Transcript_142/g.488  ORF Transcript_142/g.488 Transcript_142/m.488 type:complete len:99 (-) Transcript_142:158-454(-)
MAPGGQGVAALVAASERNPALFAEAGYEPEVEDALEEARARGVLARAAWVALARGLASRPQPVGLQADVMVLVADAVVCGGAHYALESRALWATPSSS